MEQIFVPNKYYRWYCGIIDKATERGRPDEIFENHHVVPAFIGGDRRFGRIVGLTLKEHFVCHWLLTKCLHPSFNRSAHHALFRMTKTGRSALEYKVAREALVKARTGTKHSEATRRKISEIHRGKKAPFKSAETERRWKEAVSKANTGRKASEETKRKLSESHKGYVMPEEQKAKIAAKLRNRVMSEETRRKISEARKGRGHPRSEETRRKMSESHRRRLA